MMKQKQHVEHVIVKDINTFLYTDKPVYKGHPRERQNMVFIDKQSLLGGYIVLFYQGRVSEVRPLFTGLSLFGDGL